jgi:hypothetical protein
MEKDHRHRSNSGQDLIGRLAVLDRLMAALNSSDEPVLLATLHFPHYA